MEQEARIKKLSEFYENLNDANLSLNDVVSQINGQLPSIAEHFLIGRMRVVYTAHSSFYEPNGLNQTIIDYQSPNGFENVPYEKKTDDSEGCCVIASAYPIKGHIWTEEDLLAVRFLIKLVYVYFTRTRFMRLVHQAERINSLTGTLNMLGIQEILKSIIGRNISEEYAVIHSNIKNFKYITRQMGGSISDAVLRTYSIIVADFLGKDNYFGYLAGDNFIAIIKNSNVPNYLEFISSVDVPVAFGDDDILVTISVKSGVYYLETDCTVNDAITKSSIALEAAKKEHNIDSMYFKPKMLDNDMRNRSILNIFPDALKNGEFMVYYQPKVNLRTGILCGSEALVRWRHGDVIPPSEFVPLLEKEGSVRNLDFYILDVVCRDIKRWLDKGIKPVRISTNFSKLHLADINLENNILAIIEKYKIDSKYIEVELTELSDYQYFDRLVAFVAIMHKNGIHVSIDDFGSGYSSISLIKNLRADIIKLDKSLIDNIQADAVNDPDRIISRSIIAMARELDTEVIAEGVETEFQADFLRNEGCKMAQGFLYDKPLPHDEFEKRLTGNRLYFSLSQKF